MKKDKEDVLKSITSKLKNISYEDARYVEGYIEAKTEEVEKRTEQQSA